MVVSVFTRGMTQDGDIAPLGLQRPDPWVWVGCNDRESGQVFALVDPVDVGSQFVVVGEPPLVSGQHLPGHVPTFPVVPVGVLPHDDCYGGVFLIAFGVRRRSFQKAMKPLGPSQASLNGLCSLLILGRSSRSWEQQAQTLPWRSTVHSQIAVVFSPWMSFSHA